MLLRASLDSDVIPAWDGIHELSRWIPACAGMTLGVGEARAGLLAGFDVHRVIPAKAGILVGGMDPCFRRDDAVENLTLSVHTAPLRGEGRVGAREYRP